MIFAPKYSVDSGKSTDKIFRIKRVLTSFIQYISIRCGCIGNIVHGLQFYRRFFTVT